MLSQVLKTLHHYRKENQRRKNKLKENEVAFEMRLRIYKIIKNLTWEKFENNMCEGETIVKLHRMINMCKDNLKKDLHMFDIYSKVYTATFTERLLMKMRNWPCIGRLFFNLLVESAYLRYDFLLMMTITLSELRESKHFLREEFSDWQKINAELEREHQNFEMGQTAHLQGNEDLVMVVQTKKVCKTLLNFGYHMVKKLFNSGEIDDLENKKLVKELVGIESRIKRINNQIRRCKRWNELHGHDFQIQKKRRQSRSFGIENDGQDTERIDMEGTEYREKQLTAAQKKITFIFPLLRELKTHEIKEFNEALTPQKIQPGGEIDCAGGDMFLVKSGMFKIKPKREGPMEEDIERVVRVVSTSDFFGACEIINQDVNIVAYAQTKCKYYSVNLEIIERLGDKYPNFKRILYSNAAYNYLKGCRYSQAKKKTKYFRRLRRIAYFHLNKLFENGAIEYFENDTDFLAYIYENDFESLGFMILRGSLQIVEEDVQRNKTQRFLKMKDFESNRSNEQSLRHNPHRSPSIKPHQSQPRLDENLFSMKHMVSNRDQGFQVGEHGNRKWALGAGDAEILNTHYLVDINIKAPGILIFILETSSHGINQNNTHKIARKSLRKINRKKYR